MLVGEASAQALQSEVVYDARDSIRYDARTQTVYLYGAATVTYRDLQLTAARIRYDFKNEEALAHGVPDSTGAIVGKPMFKQGAQEFEADSIRYNFRTGEGFIHHARTQEEQSWVEARTSKRLPNGEVHSKGGVLTTCDRPHPHYHFKVSRMIVVPEDKIVAGPAYMKLGNVPTPLAVPFAMFPSRSRGAAGVLIPTWGESDQLGFFLLNGGYYLPINEHNDLQLTGDIYSKGSWGARALWRYKERYHYTGSLNLSHNTLLNSDPEFPDFSRQKTFFIRWNHVVDPKASLYDRFNASVNAGSSENFTNTLNSSQLDYLSNTFQSNIQWTHLFPWKRLPATLGVNARHSQNSLTKSFDITFPSVAFNLNRFFPVELFTDEAHRPKWYENWGVSYAANYDNRVSTTEDQIYLGNVENLMRTSQNGIRHTIGVSTSMKTTWFTLNPELRLNDRMYFKTLERSYDPGTGEVVSDTLRGFANAFDWNAGATLTSKFFGMYQYRGNGLKAIRHVVTPSLGFTYRPDFGTEQEIYYADTLRGTYSPYDIGIYGKPPSGESGLLSMSLLQSLEAKVRDAKGDTLDNGAMATRKMRLIDVFNVGTSYDLMRDSLNWSAIAMQARTTLLNLVNVNFNSAWDPYAVNAAGVRYDRSMKREYGELARLTNANLAVGFELKSRKYGKPSGEQASNSPVVGEADPDRGARLNFSMPWRLNVNYSYDVLRTWSEDRHTDDTRQSVLFNGDVTVFKYWKLGASSGWDFTNEDWTPTSLNLYWDLHCWEFNFNLIPFGNRRSYSFRINIKASILRDLKYEMNKPIGGNSGLLF